MSNWKKGIPEDCDYYIFDDFPPERVTALYKQFMGCQLEFEVTDKYMPKLTISNAYPKPSIFLFNNQAWGDLSMKLDMGWVAGNASIVFIEDPLFA